MSAVTRLDVIPVPPSHRPAFRPATSAATRFEAVSPPAATVTRLVPTSSFPPPGAGSTRRLRTLTTAGAVTGSDHTPLPLTVTAGVLASAPLVIVRRSSPAAGEIVSDAMPSVPPASVIAPRTRPEPLRTFAVAMGKPPGSARASSVAPAATLTFDEAPTDRVPVRASVPCCTLVEPV